MLGANLGLLLYGEVSVMTIIEPLHVKTNNVAMRPAKTQISLGIRPVWSESSLYAQWVARVFAVRSMGRSLATY